MSVLITLADVEPAVRLNALLEADDIKTWMVSPLDDLPSEVRKARPEVIVFTGSLLDPQTLATMALDRTVGLVIAYSPEGGDGYGYGFGQWVEAKDAGGATFRVSSPGAFGFTPWVDWRSNSNGVILVFGNGSEMRDDLTALERLCLEQLDFVRRTQRSPGESWQVPPATIPRRAA